MKKRLKEILLFPPVLYILCVVAYALISPLIPHPAEKIPIEIFMEHHSAEEFFEYWEDDLGYISDLFTEKSDGEYYFLSVDEAQHLLDTAYAYGYYAGATGQCKDALSEAVANEDYDQIRDYLAYSYSVDDMLE